MVYGAPGHVEAVCTKDWDLSSSCINGTMSLYLQ